MRTLDEDFEAEDGTPLRLTRVETGASAVALVVPGIFADRRMPEHVLLRERLAGLLDAATLDVRGHGQSGGAFTWGVREPGDVARLARRLRATYARVLGVGFSFGGFHCTLAAAAEAAAGREPLFDALALVGTPAHLLLLDHNPLGVGLLRHLRPALRRRRRFTRLSPWPFPRPADPQDVIAGIAVLALATWAFGWRLRVRVAGVAHHERARTEKELALVARGLHAEYMLADRPDDLLRPLLAFVERALA